MTHCVEIHWRITLGKDCSPALRVEWNVLIYLTCSSSGFTLMWDLQIIKTALKVTIFCGNTNKLVLEWSHSLALCVGRDSLINHCLVCGEGYIQSSHLLRHQLDLVTAEVLLGIRRRGFADRKLSADLTVTQFIRTWIWMWKEMFVLFVGKDFKHQCDWKSTETLEWECSSDLIVGRAWTSYTAWKTLHRSQWGETVYVFCVWMRLQPIIQPGETQGHLRHGETVEMWGLWKGIQLPFWTGNSSTQSHWGETVHLLWMWEGIHSINPLHCTPTCSLWHETF